MSTLDFLKEIGEMPFIASRFQMSETKDWMEWMCQTYSHGRMWPSMSELNPPSYTPDPVRMGYPGNAFGMSLTQNQIPRQAPLAPPALQPLSPFEIPPPPQLSGPPTHKVPTRHQPVTWGPYTPEPASPSFAPPGIQRDLMQRNEGGTPEEILTGYVPTPSSGLTVGRGVDLAQVTQQELINYGLPAYLAYKIPDAFFAQGPGAIGPRGQAAKVTRSQHPFRLTESEAILISEVALKLITDRTRPLFDRETNQRARTSGAPQNHFDDLPSKEMTTLVDMAFVAGPGFGQRRQGGPARKVWEDFVTRDFKSLPGDITILRGSRDQRGQHDVEFLTGIAPQPHHTLHRSHKKHHKPKAS